MGLRHDIEIKPLAARDNRLGTSGGNKGAQKAADSNKVRSSTTALYCCCMLYAADHHAEGQLHLVSYSLLWNLPQALSHVWYICAGQEPHDVSVHAIVCRAVPHLAQMCLCT